MQGKFLSIGSLVVTVLLCVASFIMYSMYQDAVYEKQLSEQNLEATNDSLQQTFAAYNKLAVRVTNLGTGLSLASDSIKALKKSYVALRTDYLLAVDSVHALGAASAIATPESLTVKFSGEQGIDNFKGNTVYKPETGQSSYTLDISHDTISASSTLEKIDAFWYTIVTSNTPGVVIKSVTKLDDDVYEKLQKYSPAVPPSIFGIGGFGTGNSIYGIASIDVTRNVQVIGGYGFLKSENGNSVGGGIIYKF